MEIFLVFFSGKHSERTIYDINAQNIPQCLKVPDNSQNIVTNS